MTRNAMQGVFLAAGVAMALSGGAFAEKGKTSKDSKVQCKESNSCKGQGSCAGTHAGEKHGCKGQNSCGGNTRELTKAECKEIKGKVVASK